MSKFLHDDDAATENAKAIAIPRVFSENGQAYKGIKKKKMVFSKATKHCWKRRKCWLPTIPFWDKYHNLSYISRPSGKCFQF